MMTRRAVARIFHGIGSPAFCSELKAQNVVETLEAEPPGVPGRAGRRSRPGPEGHGDWWALRAIWPLFRPLLSARGGRSRALQSEGSGS